MIEHYYKKSHVKTDKVWSKAKRCSQNVTAKKNQYATITCDRSISFSGSISGLIKGIVTIAAGGSLTSRVGYTLRFKGPATKYMAYKVCFNRERGKRELYNTVSDRCLSSNDYCVKSPLYEQYFLKKA